jgi:hypothetical protein
MQIIIFLTSTLLLLGVTQVLKPESRSLDYQQASLNVKGIPFLNPEETKSTDLELILSEMIPVAFTGHIGFYLLNGESVFSASEFYSPRNSYLESDSKSPYILSYFYQAKDYFNTDSVQAPQRVVIHKKFDLSGV